MPLRLVDDRLADGNVRIFVIQDQQDCGFAVEVLIPRTIHSWTSVTLESALREEAKILRAARSLCRWASGRWLSAGDDGPPKGAGQVGPLVLFLLGAGSSANETARPGRQFLSPGDTPRRDRERDALAGLTGLDGLLHRLAQRAGWFDDLLFPGPGMENGRSSGRERRSRPAGCRWPRPASRYGCKATATAFGKRGLQGRRLGDQVVYGFDYLEEGDPYIQPG